MSLTGRVALVTGGSRGIGRAIALALAEDGADVAINYRRDAAAAEETARAAREMGRRALCVAASIDDTEAVDAMVETVVAELGPPSILVNNAGIASRGHTVEETDPAELERVLRVHALGPHRLCGRLAKHLRQHRRSDIVMISSVATLRHAAGGAPYNMAKAAMESLAWTLAKELRPDGVRVNIVAPGLVETEMGRRLVKARSGIEDLRQLDDEMPFGRVCQPEDIAGVVRGLVSDRFGYVTGEKINVHGGG
ncbi:MAG: SDR family NAD(P)-dependent oxidoreductase [Acidobacteria bacterium]|mgnify:CR=1 FL=1|nr:MAG: SDR family NAD(P)-dependent oxidoreductase [Acidobacteriota bacterium]REK09155.1 MAG: SDR family NAD(P)-dependent oxidoreductase [Acidobacteriota bacterium]